MWWIFQEAEQLFSILPPPPQIMLISGRLRELLCRRGNTSCSAGCFPSHVEDSSNPNEWSRREMIQTWRKLWCELPANRDLTPNCNWHSVRNRDLPEVFLHVFPWRCCPHLSQEIETAPEGFPGSLWKLQPQMAQGHVSIFLWCFLSPWSGQCSQAASTKLLFQAPGTSAFPEQEMPSKSQITQHPQSQLG